MPKSNLAIFLILQQIFNHAITKELFSNKFSQNLIKNKIAIVPAFKTLLQAFYLDQVLSTSEH